MRGNLPFPEQNKLIREKKIKCSRCHKFIADHLFGESFLDISHGNYESLCDYCLLDKYKKTYNNLSKTIKELETKIQTKEKKMVNNKKRLVNAKKRNKNKGDKW